MATKLSREIVKVLEEAVKEKIENFEVITNEGNKMGEGTLSEIMFVSLINKNTRKEYNLILKQVVPSVFKDTLDIMSRAYLNEIYFYTKVLPELLEFQKAFAGSEVFKHFPKCYACNTEPTKEKLALENLKANNYELHPRSEPLGIKLYEYIFRIYGKLHGLSFAFKHHQPERFLEMTSHFKNSWVNMIETNMLEKSVVKIIKDVNNFLLEDKEDELLKKFERYVKNGLEIYKESLIYKGDYGVICHGDCWSNNIMIKYNISGEIEDIKLFDFQVSNICSPVHDLAYSFYSGADKETLDNLEHFLQVYHKSLSETLNALNCNPDDIYPYEALKKEWKEYSTFGFIMGLLLWLNKNILDLTNLQTTDDLNDKNVKLQDVQIDEKNFKHMTINLVKHMHENDFLL